MADLQASAPTGGSLLSKIAAGAYVEVLSSPLATTLIERFAQTLGGSQQEQTENPSSTWQDEVAVGLAAFNAFLQTNVTGPVLEDVKEIEAVFTRGSTAQEPLKELRRACLHVLEVDGVLPYAYIPHIELFALARHILTTTQAPATEPIILATKDSREGSRVSLPWLRLRVAVWHYRLLTQPSLSGSSFARSMQWIDVPTLAENITELLSAVKETILDADVWSVAEKETWPRETKVEFLLEAANVHIMLGRDDKAREAVQEAAKLNNFVYALSGALGKRTKFQDRTTSQLVVLAKSGVEVKVQAGDDEEDEAKPDALALNDDTLLENIQFSKEANGHDTAKASLLPEALVDMAPDEQPQLTPLDQIILLTEATLKDSFSSADTLTAQEILPYAVRVVSDKSTNWQVYTQALLVRSRIEMHRSRTIERGVLQMQALVDQVIVDTEEVAATTAEEAEKAAQAGSEIPSISILAPDATAAETADKPTSFFRAAKSTDSAPAQTRLQFIHALASPPRWHLESELAHSWAGVGSLVSALEIFKRLRLWAEVALCLATAAAASEDDDTGRGSGGDAKAKGIIRWRLYHRTGTQVDEKTSSDPDTEVLPDEVTHLKPELFEGPERNPPVPDAPRLFCLLGDLEQNADHYERAWTISNHRYSRAQKSLGEHYLMLKDLEKARDAYKLATECNRLSPDLWSRLGDISLRLTKFRDAADAYRRAITSAGDPTGGEDARTWSNLGSALWSLYLETVDELKQKLQKSKIDDEDVAGEVKPLEDEDETVAAAAAQDAKEEKVRDPALLLSQSLAAYKRGATLSGDNWRIWDNVLTLATRCRPPAYRDAIHALQAVIRIRASEAALDADVLRALLQDLVFTQEKQEGGPVRDDGIYDPPRGSLERAMITLLEEMVVPLITSKSSLWELVSRERLWRRDYAGAIDAAEKGWRAAMATTGGGSSLAAPAGGEAARNWIEDKEAFEEVVLRTDELVGVLENFGENAEGVGARWRGKARSAVRSVMGKGREAWEGTEGWKTLESLMEGLERR
ncbi:TPR repeat-containing protein [Plectosphaerella cucumerina]|uniref:TPR repeat-containing protein n=1 Tax=Plectosphaerella cucumerina TaxID=40658 RepID=A0A8K0TSS9_9PEZI|nr:TPR repeat-containing protein [Plectosphaerella cucumerina]